MVEYNSWSREDDVRLWERRSKPTALLASEFGRTSGGILSRLKHLQNPQHKAYKRFFGNSGGASEGRVTVIDTPSMFAGALKYARESRNPPQTFPPANLYNTTGAYPSVQSYTSTYPSAPYATTSSVAATNSYSHNATQNSYTQQQQQRSNSSNNYSETSAKPTPIADGTLNSEQEFTKDLVRCGSNVFLTGAAGTGKSFLLRHIVEERKLSYGEDYVAVTASTGIAASHISGVTLHSWAGIGIASGRDVGKLLKKIFSNPTAISRWLTTKVLIIDEISMIDGVLFGALDEVAKMVRGNNHPFGGIQLVLSGDFYQLPPVSLRYAGFAFSSDAWKNGHITFWELKRIVRQKGDLQFVRLLRELRHGKCSKETERLLATCHVSRKKKSTDGIVPTKLYCTNKNVDSENELHLGLLPGNALGFESIERFKGNYSKQVQTNLRKAMDKKMPMVLQLKIGAQVMLLKNTPEWGLVNGSRGIVVGFDQNKSNLPMVLFSNGATHTIEPFEVFQASAGGAMTRRQIPLKLAWCLTVHKSQGMTLDRLELQLDDAFDYGQAYVALSRVTSLAGLWIKGTAITQKSVKAHPDVIGFHQKQGKTY